MLSIQLDYEWQDAIYNTTPKYKRGGFCETIQMYASKCLHLSHYLDEFENVLVGL